jgi:uncharacterized oligopeptide transporter (OPT) family protein
MSVGELRSNYILYIGAGAVATGGIISMLQAMPLIIASIRAGLRDMRSSSGNVRTDASSAVPRTSRDLPLNVVLYGSLALILALSLFPNLGLGFNVAGIAGSVLIVFFGFLFVTVSARLTGEIGSSSNPISGMTVATLLLTCLVFLALGRTGKAETLTALTVAAIVCVAASNGGTTAQDLKTGFLVGATPRWQQLAILIGALTSASVIGATLLLLNSAGTVYSKKPENLPNYHVPPALLDTLTKRERPGGEYQGKDETLYHVLNLGEGEIKDVPQGKFLVDDQGKICYLVDPAINGKLHVRDDGVAVTNKFEAPKTRLMALIIDGILNQKLPWELVLLGALLAITLELAGTPSLPFAVGVYLPLATSLPIFLGGAIRWVVDKLSRREAAEGDMSPGVLLSSGYIAGGAIAGVTVAFFAFLPDKFSQSLLLSPYFSNEWNASNTPALVAFGVLMLLLLVTGFDRRRGTKQPTD